MTVKQAIIPAAGRGLKPYPAWDTVEKLLHPVFDRDGLAKPVIQIIAQEVLDAGVDEVILVVRPGEDEQYSRLLTDLIATLKNSPSSLPSQVEQAEQLTNIYDRLTFVIQEDALGFGHAVWCARDVISESHWMLCPSDHLFLHYPGAKSAGAQIADEYNKHHAAVSTVEALGIHQIHRYGVVEGRPIEGMPGIWRIGEIREKPTPTQAEMYLETPGLRRDSYLCFSGLHILPAEIMHQLDRRIASRTCPSWGELTPVLSEWARDHEFLALEIDGHHQDIGTKYGLLEAQLERALCGPDRAAILARLGSGLANDALMREG